MLHVGNGFIDTRQEPIFADNPGALAAPRGMGIGAALGGILWLCIFGTFKYLA